MGIYFLSALDCDTHSVDNQKNTVSSCMWKRIDSIFLMFRCLVAYYELQFENMLVSCVSAHASLHMLSCDREVSISRLELVIKLGDNWVKSRLFDQNAD